MRRVIGFFGLKNSGKDEAAKALLMNGWDAEVHKFATPIKEMAASLLCIEVDMLKGELDKSREFREKESEFLSAMTGGKIKTPRYLLQWLGTEAFRGLHADIWVKHLEHRVQATDSDVFITDCRFENEMALVKRLGGYCVKIERKGLVNTDSHASEAMPFKEEDFDLVIRNDGSLEEFHALAAIQMLNWRSQVGVV